MSAHQKCLACRKSESESKSRSVVSDSLWTHRLYSPGVLQARILEWVAFPFSGDLPNPGIEPRSPTLQANSLLTEPSGKPPTEWWKVVFIPLYRRRVHLEAWSEHVWGETSSINEAELEGRDTLTRFSLELDISTHSTVYILPFWIVNKTPCQHVKRCFPATHCFSSVQYNCILICKVVCLEPLTKTHLFPVLMDTKTCFTWLDLYRDH